LKLGFRPEGDANVRVWLRAGQMLKVDPAEHSLVTTAPLLAPAVVNESMDQVVFEELGFQGYARVSAAESCVLSYSEHREREFQAGLSSAKKPGKRSPGRKKHKAAASPAPASEVGEDPLRFLTSSCHLVVDSGFSFTHVVPVIDGKVFQPGVRRVNVGGKLLTNYLKEIVSFRQWNVMDDTPVINELKEALCYCSMDFEGDLKRFHSDRQARKHWILPDFVRTFEGRCRDEEEKDEGDDEDAQTDEQQQSTGPKDEEQALEMGVEMVTVPEVLFHPSDIGISQAGIAETIVQAVEACPEELSGALYANILLVGGSTKFKNFRQRLERDLRSLAPDDFDVELHEPSECVACLLVVGSGAFVLTDVAYVVLCSCVQPGTRGVGRLLLAGSVGRIQATRNQARVRRARQQHLPQAVLTSTNGCQACQSCSDD